jgi:3-dehydrosphinganine reductase
MDILQRLGIPLPIATGALGLVLALIAAMGLFSKKNHMPVEGRVCNPRTPQSHPHS